MLAIIGGSGLTQLSNLDVTHRLAVRTPFEAKSGAAPRRLVVRYSKNAAR